LDKVKKEAFVIASTIAAELSTIQSISSELHMSTLNAKVVTARSSDIGKTFQPLTDYASQLAYTTGDIVKDISIIALRLTKSSVALMQSQLRQEAFLCAIKKHGENESTAEQIKIINKDLDDEKRSLEKGYIKAINKMLINIEFLAMEVRSIFYLGMNCRIEASRCLEFRDDFESIATDIELAAGRVRGIVTKCQSRIENELKVR
tara:strand:- start:18073 stop:18687 length:615 start_codon:yes stop_codon:yes gene_type:complete